MATATIASRTLDAQKLTAQAIVNIFETGKINGIYGQVTLLAGDSGHLTYGRSQTTLGSGTLYLLLNAYCESASSFAAELQPYLAKVLARDVSLDSNAAFRTLLREAGDDPVMHEVQDQFFDRVYWSPAMTYARACGVESGLGRTVVYDSVVHGSFQRIRDMTNRKFQAPPPEQTWVDQYVETRRAWLANHPNPILHKTVYRMDAFRALIEEDKWELELPLVVLGRTIDEAALAQNTPVRASAVHPGERLLHVQRPPLTGEDVLAVQRELQAAGATCPQSGLYDDATAAEVVKFQARKGLVADGVVGPATRAALGL